MITPRATVLLRPLENLGPPWPTVHLAEVVEEPAAHGRAVLGLPMWQVEPGGGIFGHHGPGIDPEIDRRSPWCRIVADCRDRALPAAEATGKASDVVATICWIGASDL